MLTEKYMTIPDAAKRISLSETQVRRRVRIGEIVAEQAGRDYLILREVVDQLAAEYPVQDQDGDR